MTAPAGLSVREVVATDGTIPFREWLATLDVTSRARIQARILRFATGNLGDHRSVGGGVYEARIMFGPGYRVYFGRVRREVILLLLGGEKGSQTRDVPRAQAYWRGYTEAIRRGTKK